jgi:hypothetical protein
MTRTMGLRAGRGGLAWVAAVAGLGLMIAAPLHAQPRVARAVRAQAARDAGTDPAELARLFDAYTVMQAQEALGLDDARFGPFVTRLRALQDLRRRHVRDKAMLMRDLRQLLQASGNEAALREKLDALVRLDASHRLDEQKARDAIDELLDVRQRARLRILEQQLELRKLELVGRARQRLRNSRP